MKQTRLIKIYTDGAYSSLRQSGGWAFYIPDLNIRIADNEPNTTISRMELTAAIQALKYIYHTYKDSIIEIYSDSMYLVGGMELNWSKEVNKDLWTELEFYQNNLDVKFIHISGHSGITENEIVDKLAVKLSQI